MHLAHRRRVKPAVHKKAVLVRRIHIRQIGHRQTVVEVHVCHIVGDLVQNRQEVSRFRAAESRHDLIIRFDKRDRLTRGNNLGFMHGLLHFS